MALGNTKNLLGGEGHIARPKTKEPTFAKNRINFFETSNHSLGQILDTFKSLAHIIIGHTL